MTECFQFGYIFKPNENNADIFNMMTPLLTAALNGHNVTVIAYGASGEITAFS